MADGVGPADWARYWRADGVPVEAMHARFTSHVYHRHSHESYSFGVTEAGAQAFSCRHGRHVSGAGMVMTFNPDDPHDGHAASDDGFTYRMVHIWPDFFASLTGSGRPLFRSPVLDDPAADGCSRFAAYRAFTQAYGIPPSDYQRQLRVRAARRLLSQGVSPALAAAQAGFADQAHLTRWFRRYYGGTPGAYRGAACPEGS